MLEHIQSTLAKKHAACGISRCFCRTMALITLTNGGWIPSSLRFGTPASYWTGGRGEEVRTWSSVTPRSWSPSTVRTAAPTPGGCRNTPVAGASSCRWPWWPLRRGAGGPATGGAVRRDWNTRDPWEGSQTPHSWRQSDGVLGLCACPNK